ncbi:MAG: transcriptional regulator [Actinobacteria bacterium]|nr:transcriptional regulator [Actinomycetota bacterium]
MIHDRVESAQMGVRFSRNAVELRARGGFTQEEVALRAGLHRTEVSLLERHQRVPRLETILRLAGGVDADPWELLEGLAWNLDREGRAALDAEGHGVVAAGHESVTRSVGSLRPAERFGLLLTRERLHASRTQTEVADLLSIDRAELSLYERGGRDPRLDSILQLAAAVGTVPAELLTGMRWIPGITVIHGHYHPTSGRPGEAVDAH